MVDAPISDATRTTAREIITNLSIFTLFQRCPTLAVWAVLTPLALNYETDTRHVYAHIGRFVRRDLSDQQSREELKYRYRIAARQIGLPVSGTDPNDLFFPAVGPARSQHQRLARAFVASAIYLGPPAIEDTPSARAWQRRSVAIHCQGLNRLQSTILFDRSAHCARRFEAWRKGEGAINEIEGHLFDAYGDAATLYGRGREDIVGPPKVYWAGRQLGLQTEPSKGPQRIRLGAIPTQIEGRARRTIPAPWPETLSWAHGAREVEIPFGLTQGGLLLFDAGSGTLIERIDASVSEIDVATEQVVALAREEFSSPSFGAALPVDDPSYWAAWVEPGEQLAFTSRGPLSIAAPAESALWLDAIVIGRSGATPLYGGTGALLVSLDPDVGGGQRIARVRFGDDVRFAAVELDKQGSASISLAELNLPDGTGPIRATFDILAPGADGTIEARSELTTSAWIWPGIAQPVRDGDMLPRPAQFDPARSRSLRAEGNHLRVDLRAEADDPILGVKTETGSIEFTMPTGAERLIHHRVATEDRLLVPRGALLTIGAASRHDSLVVLGKDRHADLLVLGRVMRRAFCMTSRVEINSDMLAPAPGGDDRIALRRKDGKIDVLARINHVDDPSGLAVAEDEARITMTVTPQTRYDALRVRIEDVAGGHAEGEYPLSNTPVASALPPGVEVQSDIGTRHLVITLDKQAFVVPARVSFDVRANRAGEFTQLTDATGARILLGLAGKGFAFDQRSLSNLSVFLAERVPIILDDQVSGSLGSLYSAAVATLGSSHMVGSIRGVLTAVCARSAFPRNDLAGVAPWIFEASAAALGNLPDGSGLAPLARLGDDLGTISALPDPCGDAPLARWLDRVASDHSLPPTANAEALHQAFRTLRYRLRDTDLRELVGDGPRSSTRALICRTWEASVDDIRSFDFEGGGDEKPARIAIVIERFARAAALSQAEGHVSDLVYRTGLSRQEIGRTLTMMLRAGVEFFVYFRAIWSKSLEQQGKHR